MANALASESRLGVAPNVVRSTAQPKVMLLVE